LGPGDREFESRPPDQLCSGSPKRHLGGDGPLGLRNVQRYVRLATERDPGSRADWLELIASNPAMEWK